MKLSAILVTLSIILLCITICHAADDYILRPGDSLNVTVLGEPDLTKQVIVGINGSVTLPLAKDVKVEGLTTTQAAQQIAEQLKPFIKNPEVTVELFAPAKMQVTVSGDVKNPGIYPVDNNARLIDAITAAGGYNPTADLTRVKVSHSGASGSATTVDLSKFLLSGDTSVNVEITGGDTIVVPTRETAAVGTVTVLGAVQQSGLHPITQGMTLREGIMLAGGPTEIADLSNITLRHEGSPDGIKYNYATTGSGDPAANPELQPGDVIFVAAKEQLGSYTIMGAVTNPGKYEITGVTTVTEAIAIAGGARERARLNDVRILRQSEGATQTLTANVGNIMTGKAPNVPIRDGDSILVAQSKAKPDYLRIAGLILSLTYLLTRD